MDAREKILQTASRLFSTHGYGSTSLSTVAKDASVSKALIFWHFESKEHLYEAVLAQTMEPYRLDPKAISGLGPAEQVHGLIDMYYAFVTRHVSSVRFFLSLFLRDDKCPDDLFSRVLELRRHYMDLLAEALANGQAMGIFSMDVDGKAHASLILSTLNGIIVQELTAESEQSTSQQLLADLKTHLVERLRIQ